MNQEKIERQKTPMKMLVVGISGQKCYNFFSRRADSIHVTVKLVRSFESAVCALQSRCFDVVWVEAPLFASSEQSWIDEIKDFHGGWIVWTGTRTALVDEYEKIQSGVDICVCTSDSPQWNNASYVAIIRHIEVCKTSGKTLSMVARELRSKKRTPQSSKPTYRNGKLSVGDTPESVRLEGQSVNLEYTEFELLRLFIRHQGVFLNRRFLKQWVWGDDGDHTNSKLDASISALRNKLRDNFHAPVWIASVRDKGFRMQTFN